MSSNKTSTGGRIDDDNNHFAIAYGYSIRCSSLEFEDDKLLITPKFTENKRQKTLAFDFKKHFLPPNDLYGEVMTLDMRPEYGRIIVAVIDQYILRTANTKSSAYSALATGRNIARFLEYCWLNHIYTMRELTRSQWDEFLSTYARGGWVEVLRIKERVSKIDLTTLALSRRRSRKERIQYSTASLLLAIGTNIVDKQIKLIYKRGDVFGTIENAREIAKPSESVIQQLIAHLNNLVDLPKEMRAECVAHPTPYLFALTAKSRPVQRTKNFEPKQLGALIAEAYRWVNEYADPIVDILDSVYSPLRMVCLKRLRMC